MCFHKCNLCRITYKTRRKQEVNVTKKNYDTKMVIQGDMVSTDVLVSDEMKDFRQLFLFVPPFLFLSLSFSPVFAYTLPLRYPLLLSLYICLCLSLS